MRRNPKDRLRYFLLILIFRAIRIVDCLLLLIKLVVSNHPACVTPMKLISLFTIAIFGIASAANADIIISQYYEGASNDKYIELFNSGTSSVNLATSNFKLSVFSNGNREVWKTSGAATSTISLTGSIAAGSTYLVRHSSALNPAYAVTASNQASGSLGFNGDDSVVLWAGTTYSYASVIDAFGATANSFVDLSYVRNSNISSGTNLDFSTSDWTLFTLAAVASAQPTETARLGFHEFNAVPEPSCSSVLIFTAVISLRWRARKVGTAS